MDSYLAMMMKTMGYHQPQYPTITVNGVAFKVEVKQELPCTGDIDLSTVGYHVLILVSMGC